MMGFWASFVVAAMVTVICILMMELPWSINQICTQDKEDIEVELVSDFWV